MKRATRSNQKSPTPPPSKHTGKKRPAPSSPTSPASPPTKTRRGKPAPPISVEPEPSPSGTAKATRASRNSSPLNTPTSTPGSAAKNNNKKSPSLSTASPSLSRRSNRSSTSSPALSSVAGTPACSPQPPKTPSPGSGTAARATRSNPVQGRGRQKGNVSTSEKDSAAAAAATTQRETSVVDTKGSKSMAAVKGKQKRPRPASSEEEENPSPTSKSDSKSGQSRKPKKKKKRQIDTHADTNLEKSHSGVDNSDDANDVAEGKLTGKTCGIGSGKVGTVSSENSECVVPLKQRRRPRKAQGSDLEAAELSPDCLRDDKVISPDKTKVIEMNITSAASRTNGSPMNDSPKNKSCIGNEQLVLTKIDDLLLNNSYLGLNNIKQTGRSRGPGATDSIKVKRESSKRRLSNDSSSEAESPIVKQSKRLRSAAQSNGVETETKTKGPLHKRTDDSLNGPKESDVQGCTEMEESVVNGFKDVPNGCPVNGVQQPEQNVSLFNEGATKIDISPLKNSPKMLDAKTSSHMSSPAKATRSSPSLSSPQNSPSSGSPSLLSPQNSPPSLSSPQKSPSSGSSLKDLPASKSPSTTIGEGTSSLRAIASEDSVTVTTKPADVDMVTDIELLLRGFGLSDDQSLEVLDLQPADHRTDGSVSASHVQALVRALLRRTTGQAPSLSAPRCNRLLRQLLDHFCSLDQSPVQEKHQLCQECVSWARESRRTALCQELEVSLMTLYASTGHWRQAEQTASALYATTRHMQDKEKTVKACLCLSQCYYALSNLSKARAFITTAKTEALKMYTPPDLQAQLDLQSGILQVAEGKDLETAISYFKEAATGSPVATARSRALKYLVLGCLLQKRPSDAHKTARSPVHLADLDDGVLAMLAVADSATTASVKQFRAAREKYKAELEGDAVIAPELDKLYIDMMEKNILNIILPYDRVQIAHVAERIELPREEVERRLSQMILDGSLSGQLDHRDHCLYLYPSDGPDPVYEAATDTIAQLEKTIVHLSNTAKKLL